MELTHTSKRILMYSHDTFGLGHLRRCREIAHYLSSKNPQLSILIISGSPIVGSFDFHSQVDFVRIPGVIKMKNGEYRSLNLQLPLEHTLAIRSSIIYHTAEVFEPDLVIVDKEPLGFCGEISETLNMLKKKGVPLILGLRDVLDEPDLLAPEWEKKKVLPALCDLYSQIWVYGVPEFCNPLTGIHLPEFVWDKMIYTGYIRRNLPAKNVPIPNLKFDEQSFLLVTPGGGGDGEVLVEWLLRAYENDRELPWPAIIVLGPFMPKDLQTSFMQRAERLKHVEAVSFSSNMESLMASASGIVGMGGYNTFCEILSFDKRAIIVPRTKPRKEQLIRALRAQEMGLLNVLIDDGSFCSKMMAQALYQLPMQAAPSASMPPSLLNGLQNISNQVDGLLTR